MPEYINGRPLPMQTLIENTLRMAGIIKLIHDGSKTDSKIFTREYRVYMKGNKTNAIVKFVYNRRDNWADMIITYESLTELRTLQSERNNNERVQLPEPIGNKAIRARDDKARGSNGSPKSDWLSDRLQDSKG